MKTNRQKSLTLALCAGLLLVAVSCGLPASSEMAMESPAASQMIGGLGGVQDGGQTEPGMATNDMASAKESTGANVGQERMISRSFALTLQSTDFNTTAADITGELKRLEGYTQYAYLYNGEMQDIQPYPQPVANRTASYTLRVPKDKADGFLAFLGEAGNITNLSESADDITLQYSGENARKQALLAEEKQLIVLMEKATVTELLEIQQRLSEIQAELLQKDEQLRLMEGQVDYTTFQIDLIEVKAFSEKEDQITFGQKMSNAFGGGISAVVDLGQGLLLVFVFILPFLVILALVVLVVVFALGHRRKKMMNPTPPKVEQTKADPPK